MFLSGFPSARVMVSGRGYQLLKSCPISRYSLCRGDKGIPSVQALRPVTSRQTLCLVWMTSQAWSDQLGLGRYHKTRGFATRPQGTDPQEQSQNGGGVLKGNGAERAPAGTTKTS